MRFRLGPTILSGLLALAAVPAVRAQAPVHSDEAAFFDTIRAPNWIGAEVPHTSIKAQRGGTCWAFSTVAFLESEVLRRDGGGAGEAARADAEPDLSEYFVVYWGYVGKAEEWARRRGEGANTGDGGLSHDVSRIVAHHGIVPEDAYVVPADYAALREDVHAVLAVHAAAGDYDPASVVRDVRAVLDRHLAPPPDSFLVAGTWTTPQEYARGTLRLEPEAYWEVTSYLSLPEHGTGELDVPDNWWDYDGYRNVPFEEFRPVVNRALDAGFPVVFDMDWGDPGANWNRAGLAVLPPDAAPGGATAERRQVDFDEGRTTDDHLVLAVDHRVLDGHDWYLIKNSHGAASGRRGYVWVRGDYFDLRVLAVLVHRDALDPTLAEAFDDA
ncbi:MAG: hypothetical protein RRA92_10130 [Gemmatimonadota bacterium]|nr:hypothetical protein [Gemmatimonadota bacterium]